MQTINITETIKKKQLKILTHPTQFMNIKIVLGTDNQFYFMADNKIIHKVSHEDLKLVIPTGKLGVFQMLRLSQIERFPIPNAAN